MRTEQFIETYAKNAETNRQRLERIDVILTEFQSSGIEVLVLKGVDLLGRAYGGVLGLRPMVDVDLLVHRQDLSQIERILRGHAFYPRVDGNPSYLSHDHVLALDMVSDIWYRDDIDAVWNRAVPRRIAGRIRPAMHPEDALVYLVAYQTIHRGRLSPQMARDVAALLDAEGELIDWHNVLEQVDRCHLRLPVYHGLAYVHEKEGAKIPLWVLETLEPPASQRRTARLYQRLVTEQRIPELGHFLLVFSRPGYRNKLLALWSTFFPSQEFLNIRYGKRSLWGRSWIRLVRPFRLGLRGGLLILRMSSHLLLPAKDKLVQPPAGWHPTTAVSCTSVQGKTSVQPGTPEGPAPT